MLSCVTQLVQALKDAQTKVEEIRQPLTKIFEMDVDHDQSISCAEYTNFMLQQMQLVDPDDVEQLQEQFRQLDVDGDGVLTMAGLCFIPARKKTYSMCNVYFLDFPDHYNLELKKTRKIVRGKVQRVDIEIVQRLPTQEAGSFPSSLPFLCCFTYRCYDRKQSGR